MPAQNFDLNLSTNLTMSSRRGRAAIGAKAYWYPTNNIHWELYCLLRDSGFITAVPKQITDITIEIRNDDYYAVDPDSSNFLTKKSFVVCVHVDATRFSTVHPDEERYWLMKAVCLDALCYAVKRLGMPDALCEPLQAAREKLPTSPPWPPLPPFDIADVERHYKEQELAQIAAGSDGHIRIVKPLDAEAGTLWIMFGAIPDSSDESIDQLQGDLRELFSTKKLGQWGGDSRSGLISDISFEVKNLARSARAAQTFLRKRWPSLDFVIADEYDPTVFEKLG